MNSSTRAHVVPAQRSRFRFVASRRWRRRPAAPGLDAGSASWHRAGIAAVDSSSPEAGLAGTGEAKSAGGSRFEDCLVSDPRSPCPSATRGVHPRGGPDRWTTTCSRSRQNKSLDVIVDDDELSEQRTAAGTTRLAIPACALGVPWYCWPDHGHRHRPSCRKTPSGGGEIDDFRATHVLLQDRHFVRCHRRSTASGGRRRPVLRHEGEAECCVNSGFCRPGNDCSTCR